MAFDGLPYDHLVTDLKPIFCIQSSTKPVNVISNVSINDGNQLFKTIESSWSKGSYVFRALTHRNDYVLWSWASTVPMLACAIAN